MDKSKFPNITGMISELNGKGVHVIFWITSMIDEDSPNYKYGYDNSYYIM